MSAEKFYCPLKIKKVSSTFSIFKSLLLAVTLLAGSHAMAFDVAPVFTNGSPQNLSICASSGAKNIDYLLTINAIAAGQPETWAVNVPAVHGTLGGFNYTTLTTGSALTPSGLTYTPAAGYSGADSFTIQVSDGIDTTTTVIYVAIHALPTLTSSLTPPAICDGTTFSYTPASGVAGASFAWSRALASGISTPAASGTGGIDETLSNITYYNETATYVYTVSAGGCTRTADVAVVVYPTPRPAGSLFDTICNATLFFDSVYSYTSGTTISWTRAAVAGISPATNSGTGNISETLTNTSGTAENAVYVFSLSSHGCSATRDLTVTVEPAVPVTAITTKSPASVCSNTLYQNFGTVAPASGVSYTWTADNATIYAQGSDHQYILVNFNDSGNALITLTANVPGTACFSKDSFAVTVSNSVSESAGILHTNSLFIYLDNTQDSYQWGFDNLSTLDSTLIPGAAFQSFTDSTPDFTDNIYWVITTKGGCMEKTYYYHDLAATNVPSANAESIKVYPNPAGNTVHVDISGQPGTTTISIVDMLGRTIKTNTSRQQSMQFDIADVPAGCYIVTGYKNGSKVATANFIKN